MTKIGESRKNPTTGVTEQYVGANIWKPAKVVPKTQQPNESESVEIKIGSDSFVGIGTPKDFKTDEKDKDGKVVKTTIRPGIYITLKPGQALRGYGAFYLRPVEE